MTDLSHTRTHDSMLKNAARVSEDVEQDAAVAGSSSHSTGFGRDGSAGDAEADAELAAQGAQRGVAARWMKKIGGRSKRQSYSHAHYRVYKRRWVGLAQLVLLNIVVSWDVSLDASSFHSLTGHVCLAILPFFAQSNRKQWLWSKSRGRHMRRHLATKHQNQHTSTIPFPHKPANKKTPRSG